MENIGIETIRSPLRFDENGVCRVAGTRVTLLTLMDAFQEGASAEEIQQEYPSVTLAEVYAVIAFYLSRREEVDAYLATVRRHEARVIAEIKSRFEMSDFRRRLLSRKPQPA
jgi:uncharacterized protein (DUF433 family)